METDASPAIDSRSGLSADELATELGAAIADLPEYESFREAKQRVEANEAAQEQIAEFERIRQEFMLARQTGDATRDDLKQLQAAQESLHDLPVMDDFLEAQATLERRLQALNDQISAPLAVDFGETAGSCCQD